MYPIILGLIVLLLSACASAPPTGPDAARTLIDESAAALGGWPALDAVKTYEIITFGGDLEPMQAAEPKGEPSVINRFTQTVMADFENNRMRLTFDASREYANSPPVRFAA